MNRNKSQSRLRRRHLHYLVIILWNTKGMIALWFLIAYWNITVGDCRNQRNQHKFCEEVFQTFFHSHNFSHLETQPQISTGRGREEK